MKVQQAQMGLLKQAKTRPDQVATVMKTLSREGLLATYEKVMNRLRTPVPLGYSISGTVVETGENAGEFSIGDRVACGGSTANHAELNFVPKNLCVLLPTGVSSEHGCAATVGAIALHGVRQADVQLGDVVLVVGLGLVGQFCVQLLQASGCVVIGVDLDATRCDLARTLGAQWTGLPEECSVRRIVSTLSRNDGADVVLLTASGDTPEPAHFATNLARDRGRIVDIGKTPLEFPWETFYERELELKMSRSYGPGRYDPVYEELGVDYPASYVRWTEKRNMQAFLDLVASGKVKVDPLITHRIRFDEAGKAYQHLLEDRSALGIVLEYEGCPFSPSPRRLEIAAKRLKQTPQIRLGVIGAGNFCKSVLLPRLKKLDVELCGLCTNTGLTAAEGARRFGFQFATTSVDELLQDDRVNTILIATRHDSHAQLTARAMKAGKSVFVEKPLALTEEDLQAVEDACALGGGQLIVGYNRRFSPLVQQLHEWMQQNRTGPWIASYRVNAGQLAHNSWYNDPAEGGGRLLGEVCHFVDLLIYLFGSCPTSVHAESSSDGQAFRREENAVYSLRFENGSIGQIIYSSEGDSRVSKEKLEVIGNGGVAVLDQFRRLEMIRKGRRSARRKLAPQKGYKEELDQFFHSVRQGTCPPIPTNELFVTSRTCFALQKALRDGHSISV